jgi:hypothetical protein
VSVRRQPRSGLEQRVVVGVASSFHQVAELLRALDLRDSILCVSKGNDLGGVSVCAQAEESSLYRLAALVVVVLERGLHRVDLVLGLPVQVNDLRALAGGGQILSARMRSACVM